MFHVFWAFYELTQDFPDSFNLLFNLCIFWTFSKLYWRTENWEHNQTAGLFQCLKSKQQIVVDKPTKTTDVTGLKPDLWKKNRTKTIGLFILFMIRFIKRRSRCDYLTIKPGVTNLEEANTQNAQSKIVTFIRSNWIT